MTEQRWQQLIDRLDDTGGIEAREIVPLGDRPGTIERVVVKTPRGRFRLSFSTASKKLEEKALFSKRGGSTVNIQVRYDETESVHWFTLEQAAADGSTWTAVDPVLLGL